MHNTSLQYFYHPDHLGSASWITDAAGNGYQHLQYLPPDSYRDGESWVEQRLGSYNTPYQFSGKEKDEETGYNYFGARYYDSELIVWLSVDPMSDKRGWISPYNYCQSNPVGRVDPDGALDGDYYDLSGRWLGSDEKNDDKVYVADSKNEDGTFRNSRLLDIGHRDFKTAAGIINRESSGNKEESLWIAHCANNAKDRKDIFGLHKTFFDQLTAPGYSSAATNSKEQMRESLDETSAFNARAAIIDVLIGGSDPTNGAVMWDGIDFGRKGMRHLKFTDHTAVVIPEEILEKYKASIPLVDPCFNSSKTTQNPGDWRYNIGVWVGYGNPQRYTSLVATGAKGKSIFWRAEK